MSNVIHGPIAKPECVTVGDLLELLSAVPADMPVVMSYGPVRDVVGAVGVDLHGGDAVCLLMGVDSMDWRLHKRNEAEMIERYGGGN